MTTEDRFPVRNVPSIVYANPPSAPINHTDDTNVSAFHLSREIGTRIPETPEEKKQVSFVPANDNEFVAISANSISGDKQFIIPTYTNTKKRENTDKKPILSKNHEKDKDFDDYIFQLYVGSISIIGLLLLFRVIQKN